MVANAAPSQRAKPRQRPQDLCWRWKLAENPDCLHGFHRRPQGVRTPACPEVPARDTPPWRQSLPLPFVYCSSRVPEESIKVVVFLKGSYRAHENASRTLPARKLPPRLFRAPVPAPSPGKDKTLAAFACHAAGASSHHVHLSLVSLLVTPQHRNLWERPLCFVFVFSFLSPTAFI